MYVRLIDNDIEELNTRYIKLNGTVYTNPLHNNMINIKALGYKELIISNFPEYDKENEKVIRTYREDADYIYREWSVQPLTEEEKERLREMYIGG